MTLVYTLPISAVCIHLGLRILMFVINIVDESRNNATDAYKTGVFVISMDDFTLLLTDRYKLFSKIWHYTNALIITLTLIPLH